MAHDNDRLTQLEDRLARIETVLEAELGVPLDEVITDLEFADAEPVEEFSTSEDGSAVAEPPAASASPSVSSRPRATPQRSAPTLERSRPEFIDRVFSRKDVKCDHRDGLWCRTVLCTCRGLLPAARL
jgi:hypothetical protein